MNGFWQNSINFKYSDATIEATFSKLELDKDKFISLIHDLGNELHNLGQAAKDSPVVPNLLRWMHYQINFQTGNTIQSFTFTPTPNDVYNRAHRVVNVGSAHGFCNASSSTSYNVLKSTTEIIWNAQEYYANGCNNTVNPVKSLAYNIRDGKDIKVTLDHISVSTAAAVNLGLKNASSLEIIGDVKPLYKELAISKRFDTLYPRMTPLICIEKLSIPITIDHNDNTYYYYDQYEAINTTAEVAYQKFTYVGQTACFVDFNHQLAIPTVNQWDPSCNYCKPNYADNKPYCNTFDILLGVYFYPKRDQWTQIINTYYSVPTFHELNQIMYHGAYNLSNGQDDPRSFDFCNGECKYFGLDTWDTNKYLSPYYLSIENIHCSDTFTLIPNFIQNLGKNPPTELTEKYLKCTMHGSSAILAAIGIAAGNLGAFGPIAITLLILPLIYIYFAAVDGDVPAAPYDLVKISKAQREFIIKVIAANDGTLKGISKDSIIHKLGVELYELAQYEEGKLQTATPIINNETNITSNSKVIPL